MTEDTGAKISEEALAGTSAMRRRKKRWDEPAEFLVASGKLMPGAIPMGFGVATGISATGSFPFSPSMNTIIPVTQSAVTHVQKLNQPKVQDELIAREIVINDTEPTIRYKLTKRQTQEEIQRSTGAVVITRGKYRPPNALLDSEKPLYLHISAGSHLKEMAERIIAVDRAASMVEEMLRQGHILSPASGLYPSISTVGQVNQLLSICLYLRFEPDSSHNIATRIRGPNDQYINHIINETGASVVLRGIGSGNSDVSYAEAQQPLHLCLSSANSKSLEAARSLAENLLDTISSECGVSRASSSKLYGAVPPPQQVLAVSVSPANVEAFSASSIAAVPFVSSSLPSGNLNCTSMPSTGSYAFPSMIGGTRYNGYGGIYPQETPLQQVALALKQAPVSTTISHGNALLKVTSNLNADAEKRPAQKRKFKELPATSKVLPALYQNSLQVSECFNKPGLENAADTRKISLLSSPEKLSQSSPPPPLFSQRLMPPPPPKFLPTAAHKCDVVAMPPPKLPSSSVNNKGTEKASLEPASESMLKLVEYDEEEEEEDEEEDVAASATVSSPEESCRSNVIRSDDPKPFWSV